MKKLFRIIKMCLFLACVVGCIFVGFYKFPKQDLKITIITEDKLEIETIVDRYQLKDIIDEFGCTEDGGSGACYQLQLDDVKLEEINKILIYRYFDSVSVYKINNVFQFFYEDNNAIYINQLGCEEMYKLTKTMLMERFILAEIIVALFIFFWIIICAIEEKVNNEIQDNHGPIYEIKCFVKNITKYRQYVFFAAKADLNAEVANSYLNRLWWLLEPLCTMLVYVIVFGRLMGKSIENYPIFLFSSILMWNYFSRNITYSVKCIRNNRDIVTKIYVPKYILLISNMLLNFYKLLFSWVVLVIMLIVFRVHITITVLWMIPVYIVMILLTFAIGLIFLHYGVFIDDLAYAVGIALQMLMYLSGIFYDVLTSLPTGLGDLMITVNPMAVLIATMRDALIDNRITNIPLILIWLVISVLVGYIGIHIVNKNENGYVKVI